MTETTKFSRQTCITKTNTQKYLHVSIFLGYTLFITKPNSTRITYEARSHVISRIIALNRRHRTFTLGSFGSGADRHVNQLAFIDGRQETDYVVARRREDESGVLVYTDSDFI